MTPLRPALLALALVLPAGADERAAPEYSARRLGSTEEMSFASLRGQVVLLNTWATWCSPCRKEMPAFEALYRDYRDQGLEMVGVNIDEGQADEQVARYVEAKGIGFRSGAIRRTASPSASGYLAFRRPFSSTARG